MSNKNPLGDSYNAADEVAGIAGKIIDGQDTLHDYGHIFNTQVAEINMQDLIDKQVETGKLIILTMPKNMTAEKKVLDKLNNDLVSKVANVDSEDDAFDHRDPDGEIRKGVQKLLKESDREDDLLVLSYLQGK
jgi:hypothetical protein